MAGSYGSNSKHGNDRGWGARLIITEGTGNVEGYIYSLNLTTSFNTSSNFMALIKNTSIAGGAANNIAPNYVDGVMFANKDDFHLYGGMLRLTNSTEAPSSSQVLSYEAYQYGPHRSSGELGWNVETLSSNVTRYITNGAGVSVPDENLGFYFSGMRAADWGAFTYDGRDSNVTADTLITVDMSVLRDSKWTNDSLPYYVQGRANAELIWVPVSTSGGLVAIGGVVDPVEMWRDIGLNASQTALSKKISPTFMETVSVYDIESRKWYLQNTTGDTPPQLTQFCSVLASASDGSSHNIYIYGGYNGIDYESNPSDDVFILSLPAFKWIKAYNGSASHGRSGHRCIKVYPDQMLTLGGQNTDPTKCLEGGMIADFNLNTLSFQNSYDPSLWSDYKVPDLVTAQIGGSSSGGATTIAPAEWTNSSLAGIFNTTYTKPITTYWPYINDSSTITSGTKGDGVPSWAGAVIGVPCGLLGIGLVIGFWIYRRKPSQEQLENNQMAKAVAKPSTDVGSASPGPTSPRPGPVSLSTDVETMQSSFMTSSNPGETQFTKCMVQFPVIMLGSRLNFLYSDSSPTELPTQFNFSGSVPAGSPQTDASRGSPSPISQSLVNQSPVSSQTPAGSESGISTAFTRHRRLSTFPMAPSLKVDNVGTGSTSNLHGSLENVCIQRSRYPSELPGRVIVPIRLHELGRLRKSMKLNSSMESS
ncbi:hypothetical protein N7462_000036 [Penicillium macrosclerotiorum]|uniref:uncharacterized protein n=1 Tax=Penicillium macrosclerotiorum TaxID=303699 RepID=UPI0025466883|nr:uncharacterized protein N7462_000036 [Penicillium macrosclerotiorum]KAJ5698031.1 hypothetical protein N7462_000036 [Penicillium macrosclerotiorum]